MNNGNKKSTDELIIYEKSEYYVFDTGIHFIRTKDGKYRNWIYAVEINKAYNALQDENNKLSVNFR